MKIVVSHDLILHLIIITFLPGAQMNQLCTNAQAPKQFKLCKSCASNSATDSNRARRIKECPGVTFHLPHDNQKTDYIRYRDYVPSMKEATACAWVETSDYFRSSAVWSYSVLASDNEWLLEFSSPTKFTISRRYYVDFTVSPMNGRQKVHLCSWYSSSNNQIAFYLNTRRIDTRSVSMSRLTGGGTLILGQEQDAIRTGFLDAKQALTGNITNFMIWPRVLTDQEISNIARKCECPTDYAVAMTLDRSEMFGEASYTLRDACPTF